MLLRIETDKTTSDVLPATSACGSCNCPACLSVCSVGHMMEVLNRVTELSASSDEEGAGTAASASAQTGASGAGGLPQAATNKSRNRRTF